MRWTERQRAMLREMGVRTWLRPGPLPGSVEARDEAAVVLAEREPDRSSAPLPARPMAVPTALSPCDWLIVGDPLDAGDGVAGEQERLLDNMLKSIGVSRTAPTRAARACHVVAAEGGLEALRDTLDRVRPRCALALGRVAAQALLGVDEPIGRLRGSVHQRAGLSVVVSFPLAYLLRNPTEKAKAWADLCLAVAAVEASPA